MKLPDISVEVWENNYKYFTENTLHDTFNRQAEACVQVEKEELRKSLYDDFMWLLDDFKGAAGGRITANLGINDRLATTLYNCFVHHPGDINYKDPDSINGIYDMLKAQAHTLKSEGGYGSNFSYLRPAGGYIKGIGGRTPGVLKFLELWDKSSEIITSGFDDVVENRKESEKKKIRKGAQMGVLCVWHPEIESFINAKLVPNRLTKFNLSVGVHDDFMDAVIKDELWTLRFPDTTSEHYKEWAGDIYDWEAKGYPVVVYKTIKARELWNKITYAAYTRNEPGILFLGVANKLNPLSYVENILASNPCAEICMGTGVCLLFSLNLVKYIKKINDKYEFDYESFERAVKLATRFADNINDISRVPLSDYNQAIQDKRRIGIGILGLGSLHYILGIRYGSQESQELTENIFKLKCETELLTSALLGKEKGSFKLFNREKYFNTVWWKTLPISQKVKEEIENIGEMRNSHHSANAPTGNMSLYVGVVSNGVEPVFAKEYYRWMIVSELERTNLKKQGFKFPDVQKSEWFETDNLKFSLSGDEQVLVGSFNNELYQVDKNRGLTKRNLVIDYGWQFVKENFSEEKINELNSKNVFATTNDLSVSDHINVLKVIAKYVNMNTSKTVNLPNNYSYEDFQSLYFDAWKSNIKGITCYRQGTMTSVLESASDSSVTNSNRPKNITTSYAPKRTQELVCDIKKAKIQGEAWTIFVGLLNGQPYEVFGGLSKYVDIPNKYKSGKIIKTGQYNDGSAVYNVIAGNGDDQIVIKDIVNVFENKNYGAFTRILSLSIRHGTPIQFVVEQLQKDKNSEMTSFSKVMARVLKSYIKNGTKSTLDKVCPECKSSNTIIYQEGCMMCSCCGWSKCA